MTFNSSIKHCLCSKRLSFFSLNHLLLNRNNLRIIRFKKKPTIYGLIYIHWFIEVDRWMFKNDLAIWTKTLAGALQCNPSNLYDVSLPSLNWFSIHVYLGKHSAIVVIELREDNNHVDLCKWFVFIYVFICRFSSHIYMRCVWAFQFGSGGLVSFGFWYALFMIRGVNLTLRQVRGKLCR